MTKHPTNAGEIDWQEEGWMGGGMGGVAWVGEIDLAQPNET